MVKVTSGGPNTELTPGFMVKKQVAAGVNETVSCCEGEKTSTDRKSRDDLGT